jgi:transposase
MLAAYDIEVELLIMDAGYASKENHSKLTSANISFLTRMPQNKKELKKSC